MNADIQTYLIYLNSLQLLSLLMYKMSYLWLEGGPSDWPFGHVEIILIIFDGFFAIQSDSMFQAPYTFPAWTWNQHFVQEALFPFIGQWYFETTILVLGVNSIILELKKLPGSCL